MKTTPRFDEKFVKAINDSFIFRQVDPIIQKRVLDCCEYVHEQGIKKDENVRYLTNHINLVVSNI